MLISTAVSASILSFLYVNLSLNVIGYRRKYGISIGDGDHEDFLRAIRAQANLTEYAPIGLILLACLELNQAPLWLTSVLATVFVLGRLIHPLGMKKATLSWQPRVRGMMLTIFSLITMGIANLAIVGMLLYAN